MRRSIRGMRVPLLLILLTVTFIPSGLRVLTESDGAIVASGTQLATTSPPTQQQPHAPAAISTSSDVESFFDTFFIQQREQHHIPGAVVALVRDGQLVLAKGYGYADLEARAPVAPDETVFRVASVSKPFTAMAIMQLYERGLLDLDEDVNTYLTGFHLNQTYAEPVTVAHLLTHTAGFDEKYVGIAAQDGVRPAPLESYIPAHLPPRVLPPGAVFNYSNYGYALAGHIVAEVSGESFPEYMQKNVLHPLDMDQSTFAPGLATKSDLAAGYEYRDGRYQPVPFQQINLTPAAGLHTTATDMAQFMIAQLQLGRHGDRRILQEDTMQEMQRRQFANDPRLPGFTYGFFEEYNGNRRVLKHEGAWRGFTSEVLLLPEEEIGLFVAYNRMTTQPIRALNSRFLDYYAPAQEGLALAEPATELQREFSRFAGTYRTVRYPRHSLYKLWSAFNGLAPELRVTADRADGLTLHYSGDVEQSTQWVEIESLLFQQVNHDSNIAFREGQDGRITYMFARTGAFERIAWYETATFHTAMAGVFALIFASTCVLWLMEGLRGSSPQNTGVLALAQPLSGLVGALNLVFLGMLALVLRHFDLWTFADGAPPSFILLLLVPLITTTLTIAGLPACTLLVWHHERWSIARRVHFTVVTLTALCFIPFLLYWNLLGFRF